MIQFDIYRDSTKEIYADDVPEFPKSNNWGNLSNKVYFILCRLDYLNTVLVSISEKIKIYNIKIKQRNGLKIKEITPYIEIIHVMSDLRMITDELIALLYIVERKKALGDYPSKIVIDSIGVLLGKWKKEQFDDVKFFIEYKGFLKTINEVTNTYKHSFINDHIIFYRQLEKPTVYALKNINGAFDIEKNKLITIPLEDVISKFNEMFKNYMLFLKKMTN